MSDAPDPADRDPKGDDTRLLTDPVGPTLVRLAWPMLLGIGSIMMFNIVDTVFVGQLGMEQLAAMSFTFPVTFFVISIAMGIGVGTTSVISRFIGEGDRSRVQRIATDALGLATVVVVAVGATGYLTIDPVFRAMGASEDLLPKVREYMGPWYLGVGFLVIPMVGNSAIRATGDTRSPSLVMMIAGLVNLALDPLLIFGIGPFPALGLKGAAIATVISWMVTFIAALYLLIVREKLLARHWPGAKAVIESWKRVLFIGLPAAATNIMIPLSGMVLMRIVSTHGTSAVAAFGVGGRLEGLALVGIIALATGSTPLVGQNFGARNALRVRETLRLSIIGNLAWGVGCAVVLAVGAQLLPRLFNDDPEVVRLSALYLWIVPASYGALGVGSLVTSAFNAVNRPLQAAAVTLLRMFVLAIPLAYLGSELFGLIGVLVGVGVANLITGVVAYFYLNQFLRVIDVEFGPGGAARDAPLVARDG